MLPSLIELQGRDTDADWREIGASEPYWGVLTNPRFRRAAMTGEELAEFYRTGQEHIDYIVSELRQLAGGDFAPKSAIDFGCGAGRLTEAMTAYCDTAIGVDVSPGMIEEARRNGGGRARYELEFPDAQVDWVNSYIVFQHIPPARGMALLERLLDRVEPNGFASLHFTIYRDGVVAKGDAWQQIRIMWNRMTAPKGVVLMYDYDLAQICRLFHARGMQRLSMVHTDHGGHHGVIIFARRAPAA
jgi:SAM-dependent methyltransferase